jgi:hypothetical protein
MGHLLDLIAPVLCLNSNDPGTGFYSLSQELELLPVKAPAEKKEEFWSCR